MAHAEQCPVCNGQGRLTIDGQHVTTTVTMTRTCHGCGGTGWVTVQDPSVRYGVGGNHYTERQPTRPTRLVKL